MTLLNETDILGQYLEKEVSPMPHQGKWGLIWGHAPLAQLSPPHLPLPASQDCFFYSLVFDPVQKTLLADQGEIRVGCKYQAEIPDRLAEGRGGLCGTW